MSDRQTPARRPRHARPTPRPEVHPEPAESRTDGREKAVEPRCNLPGCGDTPEWRGLCSAHRQTHRGLADPKPVQFQPDPIHTREARP